MDAILSITSLTYRSFTHYKTYLPLAGMMWESAKLPMSKRFSGSRAVGRASDQGILQAALESSNQPLNHSLVPGFQRLNIGLNGIEMLPRYDVRWIQAQRNLKLFERFIRFA